MSNNFINDPTNGTVYGTDRQGYKLEISKKDLKFRIAVYGLLTQNQNLLVIKNPDLSVYSLPGGAIELGETIQNALIREFFEETGITVEIGSLFEVKEDFYSFYGNSVHSILIFYKVSKVGGELKTINAFEDLVEAKFINLNQLNSGQIDRVFKSVIERL